MVAERARSSSKKWIANAYINKSPLHHFGRLGQNNHNGTVENKTFKIDY